MIQSSAFVSHFKADTDLLCLLQEDLLIGYHNKSGRIIVIVIDLLFQNLKSVISAACSLQIAACVGSFSFRIFFAATAVLAAPICCQLP